MSGLNCSRGMPVILLTSLSLVIGISRQADMAARVTPSCFAIALAVPRFFNMAISVGLLSYFMLNVYNYFIRLSNIT